MAKWSKCSRTRCLLRIKDEEQRKNKFPIVFRILNFEYQRFFRRNLKIEE